MIASIDESRYPCRPQRFGWLCIPAAIENVLAYLGQLNWAQERIFGEWYLWRTRDRWLAGDWTGIEVRVDPNDRSVWERFLPTRIELESPARALQAGALGAQFVFDFRKCPGGAVEALAIIEGRLGQAEPLPTITARAVPGGAHVGVVTGIRPEAVRYHDPGTQLISTVGRSDFAASLGSEPQLLLVGLRE